MSIANILLILTLAMVAFFAFTFYTDTRKIELAVEDNLPVDENELRFLGQLGGMNFRVVAIWLYALIYMVASAKFNIGNNPGFYLLMAVVTSGLLLAGTVMWNFVFRVGLSVKKHRKGLLLLQAYDITLLGGFSTLLILSLSSYV